MRAPWSLRLGQLLGAVEGDERVEGDDVPAAAAERLRDGGADPARAPGDDGDPMTWAHGVVGVADGDSRSSSRPSKRPSVEPPLEEIPVGEPVAEAAAVIACLRAQGLGMPLVVDARRRAGRHDAADVGVRPDDLLHPGLLGLGAHVEHLDPRLPEQADGGADELGPQHRQLRVVDGHDRLLGRRRHREHVGEIAAQDSEERDRAVGPPLGQRDPVAADDLVAHTPGEGGALGFEAGAVNEAVDLVLPPVDHGALGGDLLDAGRAVDQRDVGAVEGRQVLVVEAGALADVAVVRLEDLSHGVIGDDVLDPPPVCLHDPEVELLPLCWNSSRVMPLT